MPVKYLLASFYILLFSIIALPAIAQNTGSIRGKLFEKNTPLAFVHITVFQKEDSTNALQNVFSDTTGKFVFTTLPFGQYLLHFQIIGYLPAQAYLEINTQRPAADAGKVILAPDTKQLKTVTVTAQKALIQKTPKGFIVNAAANLTQLGGTATDLLRNTPTVTVDAEGVITLRGKSPLILINGRNSGITRTDQIAASSIETIEIINNPSAQYDADAEGGIINIKLKKNKQPGTNGALAMGAGAGAKGRFNSAFLLNHKSGKMNYAIAYDNRFAGRTRNITGDRVNFDIPDEYYLTQVRADERKEQLQNIRLNIDYSPNAKNSLGLEVIGNGEGKDNDEFLTNTIHTQANKFGSKNTRRSIEIGREKVAEAALNYSHRYANKQKEFSASVSTALGNEEENTDITSQALSETDDPEGAATLQKTYNYQNTNVTNLKADYVFPVSAKALIATGYKGVLRFLDADFQSLDYMGGIYLPNPQASNIFTFKEQVHAAYAQYSAFTGEANNPLLRYDVGLRAEEVGNNGNTSTNQIAFNNNYFNLFPSANIAWYQAAAEFWKLSYSRRINRPGLGQLNPFVDITDSLNQHGGNPYLQPELVHSFELGYSKDWKNTSVYSILYYRNASNSIRQYTVVDSNGVGLTKPANFGKSTTYGIENIFTAKPFTWYDLNLSISLFEQKIEETDPALAVANSVLSWNGKWINNFVLWPGSKLQVIGVYNSPVALPQGKRIAVYNADLGFQQKVGKGNARLGLVVTDLFQTQQSGYKLSAPNFTYNRIGWVDSRAVLLTFAYTFGTSFKEKLLENKFTND